MRKTLDSHYYLTKLFPIVLFAFLLSACSKESVTLEPELVNKTECEQCLIEQAFPTQVGTTHTIRLRDQLFTYTEYDGMYVYGGDILLTQEQIDQVKEMARNNDVFRGVGRLANRWPGGVVYYSIEKGLANKQRVFDAMAAISAVTSITFQEAVTKGKPSSRTPNYVNFRTGSGCSSFVGMIGGAQSINLATGCSTGNTIHEICHALGIYHEQSRIDRDNYVIINFENITSGTENNFAKVSSSFAADYTPTLDFGSIMMYSSFAFSKNGLPTITKLDGSTYSVQRDALSSDDISTINTMYP